jgi:hypothetical protein
MDLRRSYDILDVPLDATVDDIRRQHRDLVSVWHPDRYAANPRLRKKAERKLSEINAAYDAVMAFVLENGPASQLREPTTAAGESEKADVRGGPDHVQPPKKPFESAPRQWAAAKPRSVFRRLVMPLILISLLGSCVLMLTRLDGLIDQLRHPATSLNETLKKLPIQPSGLENKPEDAQGVAATPGKKEKRKTKRFVEIHLKNGSVITAATYRVKGDMVFYRVSGGTLGIKKSKIAQIRHRELKSE